MQELVMEERLMRLGTLSTHSFKAHLDRVRLQTSRETERLWVEYPEAVAIIPMISENEIILVRQWRYAAGEETLEIPAGKMNYGESPEEAANRELLEETGYLAGTLTLLTRYYPAYGYSNEIINLYLARDLVKKGELTAIDEISRVEVYSQERLFAMVREGKIMDAKTILAASLLKSDLIGTQEKQAG